MKKEVILVLMLLIISGCVARSNEVTVNYNVNKEDLQDLRLTLDDYPLVIVHGHAISIGEAGNFLNEYKQTGSFKALSGLQDKLSEDNLYASKNVILPFQNSSGVCDKIWDKKVSVRTTYYVDYNGKFDDHKSIATYAARVGKVVDILKKCTNSDKVNLIGHSMGGLVVREYARTKPWNVNKIITIATPNQGLQAEYSGGIKSLCDTLRYENDIECREMQVNSNFLKVLNQNNPNNISYYGISGILKNKEFFGVACVDYGSCNDGLICTRSTQLNNAKNYLVYAEKVISESLGRGIHNELVHPDTEPGFNTYKILINILANKEPESNSKDLDKVCVNQKFTDNLINNITTETKAISKKFEIKDINFNEEFIKLKSKLLELFESFKSG